MLINPMWDATWLDESERKTFEHSLHKGRPAMTDVTEDIPELLPGLPVPPSLTPWVVVSVSVETSM